MKNFFTDVSNFFNQIWDFVEQLFGWLVSMVKFLGKATQILGTVVAGLPWWMVAAAVALIAVCVMYKVLGRESTG